MDSGLEKLDAYVNEMRTAGYAVPSFSPNDGGLAARCLFLLRDPSLVAVETGVIDRGNPDRTARRFTRAQEAAGLPRELTISWNAIPWYVGDKVTAKDKREGRKWLIPLLRMLKEVRVVVLFGNEAQEAEPIIREHCPEVVIISGTHPSRGSREGLHAVVKQAARIALAPE